MLNLKEFNLVRCTEKEIVFRSKVDLVTALKEFSSDNDVIVTYRDGDKLKSVILTASIMTRFRSGDVELLAEEDAPK